MSSGPEDVQTINRREAVRRVSAMLGGAALVGGSAFWEGCRSERAPAYAGVGAFTPADVAFLDEVAETILPATKTPGAKAAMVGPFMALMVTDCYDEKDQKIFMEGLKQLDAASTKASNTTFMAATPQARLALLESLDKEQKSYMDAKKDDDPSHYFRMMKELSLLGYFTSEIGYTQAMRYVESPGRFDPCVPYTAGELTWASHA